MPPRFSYFLLFSNKWEQCHKARALDCFRQLALMLGANVRVARIDDLGLTRNITTQKLYFLVINVLEIL
jgi:hypothetical protein